MLVWSQKIVRLVNMDHTRHTLTRSQGLNSFFEACYLVYDIDNPAINHAVQNLRSSVSWTHQDDELVSRCQEKRIERVLLLKEAAQLTVCGLFCAA